MRTLRVSLAGTVTFVMLGGLGGGALAQDESDSDFPTGTFASVDNSNRLLELDADGTGSDRDVVHDWDDGSTLSDDPAFTYVVDGDRYTEWTVDELADIAVDEPPTYRRDYDGERRAFLELLSGDQTARQYWVYQQNTYRVIGDPRMVVFAAADIEAGDPIPYWKIQLGFVPAAELGPRFCLDPEKFADRVPLAPIAKGQPITPDLLVPPE